VSPGRRRQAVEVLRERFGYLSAGRGWWSVNTARPSAAARVNSVTWSRCCGPGCGRSAGLTRGGAGGKAYWLVRGEGHLVNRRPWCERFGATTFLAKSVHRRC